MFCPKCGNDISDDAAFCGNCGNKIEKPKAAGDAAAPSADAPKAASGAPGASVSGGVQLDNKKIGLIVAVVVIAILVILAIVTGGFGMMGGSSSGSNSGSGGTANSGGYASSSSSSSSGSGSGIHNINEFNEALKNGDLDDQIYGSGSSSSSGSGSSSGTSKTVNSFSAATGLSIDGSKFNKSGNMWNFSGTLRNSSSNYTYKDVKVKLSLMSGGMSVGSTTVTLDMRNSTDSLKPNSTTPISINVDYSGNVSDVQVDLVSATQISS